MTYPDKRPAPRNILLVQTRHTGRRVFPAIKHTHRQVLAGEWSRAGVDYLMLSHGPNRETWPEGIDAQHSVRRNTNIGPLIAAGIGAAVRGKYKFVWFLDDDGYFPDVPKAVECLSQPFRNKPRVGACGPIHSFLLYFNHGRNVKTSTYPYTVPLSRTLWATLGCQVFRTKAVSGMCAHLLNPKLITRADVYQFTQLALCGWSCFEVMVPFVHTCSWLRTTPGKIITIEDLEARRTNMVTTFDFIVACARETSKREGVDGADVVSDIERLRKLELRRVEKFIKKAGGQ